MDDAERKETIARLLRDADWEALDKATKKYALSYLRGRFKETADDVKQKALAAALLPGHDWDVEKVPTLQEHLRHVVNSIAANQSRTAAERTRAKDGEGEIARAAGDEPSPESTANDRELLELVATALVREFGERGRAYLQVIEGVPDEQAVSMGLTGEQLSRIKYKAREYCKAALAQQREDARHLVGGTAPRSDIAPEAAAELAAFLEERVHGPARRKARIYVMRALLAASLATLAGGAVWYYRWR